MLKVRGSIFLAFAVTAALLPATDASAATTAQRFADAVERGKSAIRAKEPEFVAAYTAIDWPRCDRVLERRKAPPTREVSNLVVFLLATALEPMIRPAQPVLAQIVADLEAIPTRDPILRSGRAAWRDTVKTLAAFPDLEKPCEQLERWAKSGWKASARPDFPFEGLEDEIDEADRGGDTEAKLERAARRMRRLGVSKGDAERFTGETLFDDLPDEITEVSSDVDEGPRL